MSGVFVHLDARDDDPPPPCPRCSWALDLHATDGTCPPFASASGIELARWKELAAHEAADVRKLLENPAIREAVQVLIDSPYSAEEIVSAYRALLAHEAARDEQERPG